LRLPPARPGPTAGPMAATIRDGSDPNSSLMRFTAFWTIFFTVLRQAMAGDERDPAGIYFGTNSGSVFASIDEGVIEAAVVGLPDEKWGDRVHAVITSRPGVDATAVLAHAAQRLANYKRPKSIEIWPELPKSAANKILRRTIRDQIIARATGHAGGSGIISNMPRQNHAPPWRSQKSG